MSQLQGELKRSIKFKTPPTELHMKQCSKKHLGKPNEVTSSNKKTKNPFAVN